MSDHGEPLGPVQERDEMSGRSAVAWWVGTVLVLAASAVVALLLTDWLGPGGESGRAAPDRLAPDRPLYTTGPHATTPDSATRAWLDSYAWVDRDAGIVAVPVSEAMRLLAARADSSAGAER